MNNAIPQPLLGLCEWRSWEDERSWEEATGHSNVTSNVEDWAGKWKTKKWDLRSSSSKMSWFFNNEGLQKVIK